MHFFDTMLGRCFTVGLVCSHALAAALYLSIAGLLVCTLGSAAWWLLH